MVLRGCFDRLTVWPIGVERARLLLAGVGLLVVAGVWLTTLQVEIGAGNDPAPDPTRLVGSLVDDTGEFAVAWQTWGVTHPPAYPLLNGTANVLTAVLETLGARPMVAASLVSWLAGVGALVCLALPIGRFERGGWGMMAAILLPAFGGLVWLYVSLPEVYSTGLLLAFGSLALAVAVGYGPTRGRALALGLLVGLAIGHHRTLLMLLPAWGVAAWPARGLGWRVWLGAAGLAVASLGVYVYLPLAAWAGSPWVYGRSPATWGGFTDALLAREYGSQVAPPGVGEWIPALGQRVSFLAAEMTTAGLVLGVVGLAVALYRPATRRVAASFGLVAAGYLLAPVGQYLLIGTHMLIMTASLALAGAWGLGLAGQRPVVGAAGLGLTLVVAGSTLLAHRDTILGYTRDPLGRRLVEAVATLEESNPLVVEVWGPRYFALAFGKWASGELADVRLMDGRADLSGLAGVALPETIYTTADYLYLAGPERWGERLGTAVSLESAGDGVVAIRPVPRLGERVNGTAGAAVTIVEAQAWLEEGAVRLVVQWQAVEEPALDYHVFVHVSDRPEIGGPADIVAQGDRLHPVYGFYPTSSWATGEVVRDDYRIDVWNGRRPVMVAVGLYTVAADGTFINHVRQVVPIDAEGNER